jgi:hypothetical protein
MAVVPKTARKRLLRGNWKSIGELAQEVWACLNFDIVAGAAAAGTNTKLARVVSGAGGTYTIDLAGPGESPDEVEAAVRQIAEDATVPAGTVVTAVQNAAGDWEFQPAVWLEAA